jgi:mRNA-degrading endonuclease HigB of HigAB toxin-antitoxin module
VHARGRGAQVAAGLKRRSGPSRDERGVRTRARRVAVKARFVKLNPRHGAAGARPFVCGKAVDAHLRYLERDGMKAAWTSTADVKRLYATASIVSADRIVFNIKGNDYRLVVAVDFEKAIVWIKWVGTHKDYSRINVKEIDHGD